MTSALTNHFFEPDLPADTSQVLELTPAEQALIRSGALRRWYACHLCEYEAGGLRDVMNGGFAAPVVTLETPLAYPDGGPDNLPYIKGQAADPVGMLWTPSSEFSTSGNWTIFGVAKAGTSVAAVMMSIVGAAGNNIQIALRTSDLVRVFVGDASGSEGTAVMSAAATSADWNLIALSYNPTTDALSLYVNGVLAQTITLALTFNTSRISILGGYDTGVDMDAEGRGLSFQQGGVLDGDIAGDAALKALLDAMVLSRVPSVFA